MGQAAEELVRRFAGELAPCGAIVPPVRAEEPKQLDAFGFGISLEKRLETVRRARGRLTPWIKRRVIQGALLDAGVHPFGYPLRGGPERCADCALAFQTPFRNVRRYWKCERKGDTASDRSDLRVSWPACVFFQARTD